MAGIYLTHLITLTSKEQATEITKALGGSDEIEYPGVKFYVNGVPNQYEISASSPDLKKYWSYLDGLSIGLKAAVNR